MSITRRDIEYLISRERLDNGYYRLLLDPSKVYVMKHVYDDEIRYSSQPTNCGIVITINYGH